MGKALSELTKKLDRFFDFAFDFLIQPLIGLKMWQNWFWLLAVVFLLCWIIVNIVILTTFSRSWLIETFKWLQLFCLLIAVFSLAIRINKKFSLFLIAGLVFLYSVLITFFAKTYTHLTLVFISRNITDIGSIKSYITLSLLMVGAVSLIGCWAINKFSHHLWRPRLTRWLVVLMAASVLFLPFRFRNELVVFAQTAYHRSLIVDYYQNFYDRLIEESAANKAANLIKWRAKADEPLPAYLDNIIFLHLESFNGLLATASITPNFYNFAAANYFFPDFYANNVQTIYGQENILCSMPGSFDSILVTSGEDKKILCLPEMLKSAGYRTFFAKAGDLNFAHTDKFMADIGFTETHNEDLMQKDDPRYIMGYREDVFYNRVFDYLGSHPAKRNFIYIAVSGTNHWPFDLPEDITAEQKAGVPYPDPKDFREHLSNNTYLQDGYLGVALKRIDQLFPDHNYTLMVFGDHAWPLGQHPNNIFIGADCYKENFSDALAIKIGVEPAYQRQVAAAAYSQMDIIPSLAQLFNIDYPTSTFYRSFFSPAEGGDNKIIMVQPFADQCLNVLTLGDNKKLRYDAFYDRADIFDLKVDPGELSPQFIKQDNRSIPAVVKEFLDFAAP